MGAAKSSWRRKGKEGMPFSDRRAGQNLTLLILKGRGSTLPALPRRGARPVSSPQKELGDS